MPSDSRHAGRNNVSCSASESLVFSTITHPYLVLDLPVAYMCPQAISKANIKIDISSNNLQNGLTLQYTKLLQDLAGTGLRI